MSLSIPSHGVMEGKTTGNINRNRLSKWGPYTTRYFRVSHSQLKHFLFYALVYMVVVDNSWCIAVSASQIWHFLAMHRSS